MARIHKKILPRGFLMPLLVMISMLFVLSPPGPDTARAGQRSASRPPVHKKDRISLQLLSGILTAPTCIGPDTEKFDYIQTNLRLGWMLNSPAQRPGAFFRGNFESILEVTHSHVYRGSGNIITGVSGLLRYNLVPYDLPLSAYLQLGGGVVYTDIYKDRSQEVIGQAMEFTPQASLALRYHLNDAWSIEAEGMFHHISNAGLSDRNIGLNAMGGFIGLTYYFDSRPKTRHAEASEQGEQTCGSTGEYLASSMSSNSRHIPNLSEMTGFENTVMSPWPAIKAHCPMGGVNQTESGIGFFSRTRLLFHPERPSRLEAAHPEVAGREIEKNPAADTRRERKIIILPVRMLPAADKNAKEAENGQAHADVSLKSASSRAIFIKKIRLAQRDTMIKE